MIRLRQIAISIKLRKRLVSNLFRFDLFNIRVSNDATRHSPLNEASDWSHRFANLAAATLCFLPQLDGDYS